MRTTLATLFLLTTFAWSCSSVFAGKLSKVRESVREEKPKSESKKKEKSKKSSSSRSRDKDSDFSWLSFSLSLFESSSDRPTVRQQSYTEPAPLAGTSIATTNPPPATSSSPPLDGWFGRLTILGGTDFETLDHGHIAWLGQIPNSLGLDLGLTTFRESSDGIRDQLWLGDANLVYEPIFGDLRARIGVGFNWLRDSVGTEFGGNLTAGFDYEIFDTLVATGEVDTGSLGDADFFHGQISLGYQIGATELFAGYNYYDIGGAKLDGTMFGLRFRF